MRAFRALAAAAIILVAVSGAALGDQLNLATQHHDSPSDFAKYKLEAQAGSSDAAYQVGSDYEVGEGVPQNYAEAMKWYRKAESMGSPLGAEGVASMYDFGTGVPEDHAQAAAWFNRAAELGSMLGMGWLGLMYRDGRDVPRNYAQAYMWFSLAAAQAAPQDSTGASLHALDASSRDDMATHLTPSQLAEAQRLTSDWMAAHPKAIR